MRHRKNRIAYILAFISIITMTIGSLTMNASASTENIALGRQYVVSEECLIDNAFPNNRLNDPNFALTDGKTTSNPSPNSTEWVKMFRGVIKYVDFDFGKDVLVKGYSMNFLAYPLHGIYPSREVSFMISADGENYYTVDTTVNQGAMTNSNARIVTTQFDGEEYFKARYVRLAFTSEIHVYVDEIAIFGTTESGSIAHKSYQPDPAVEYPNEFVTGNERLKDITNIILMYNSKYYNGAESEIGKNTYDNLLPYAAYIDTSRKIVDIMYDTFLFLPLNPGNVEAYSYSKQVGVQDYIDNTIGADEDINMTALNRLVGDIKEKLELDDNYKVKVFMSVPFQKPSNDVFGTLDGSTSVRLDSYENRLKVIKWIIDQSMKQFNEAGFENLELVGFYWYEELINYTLSDYEEELVKAFNDYVHSKDLGSLWIPYYLAPGSLIWKELGFDAATLQSGYAFKTKDNPDKKPESVTDAMLIAKKYGLGVEFEIDGAEDNHERYKVYMDTALELGANNGISAYYQAGGPGVFSNVATSSASSKRWIYDITYKYIHNIQPKMGNVSDLIVVKDSNRNNALLPFEYPSALKNTLMIKEYSAPEHGLTSIERNGFLSYIPEEGFEGEQTLSFRISDGYEMTEQYTIKIIVSADAIAIDSIKGGVLGSNDVYLYEGEGHTGTEGDTIYEVVIGSDNVVISAGRTSNSQIPEGGIVISASGEKADALESKVKVGDTMKLDRLFKNILFVETPITEEPTPKSNALLYSIIAGTAAVIGIATALIIKTKKKKRS